MPPMYLIGTCVMFVPVMADECWFEIPFFPSVKILLLSVFGPDSGMVFHFY